jgi:hypothetical protein
MKIAAAEPIPRGISSSITGASQRLAKRFTRMKSPRGASHPELIFID